MYVIASSAICKQPGNEAYLAIIGAFPENWHCYEVAAAI